MTRFLDLCKKLNLMLLLFHILCLSLHSYMPHIHFCGLEHVFFFSMPVQSLTPGCQIHSYLHCLTPTACLNVNYKETEAETWREIFLQLSFLDYCVLFFRRVFHLPSQCPVISFINLLVFRSAICSVSNQLLTTLLYPF